ncbi:MAG: restriction endonuclease subunit S [Candidatus Nanoarchaeia archaeon]|nr:restriction endonuclease subunit S [Candidatus Nanoarchaeia archaeon]
MADQITKILKGWKTTTLGEVLCPISNTFNFNGVDKVHFLNTGDILDGKLLHNNLVPTKTLPGQAKKKFKPNDILYSEIRPANKRYMLVNFDSSNSVASTKLMVLRTKENVDVIYIYKYITFREMLNEFQMIAESRSGTFPQITFDSISKIELSLPPLPEQRAIVEVLSSLDDKIDLLREQIKTLEATAQEIFKEWFVNFNFPDSTRKMINSELGQIPEGWKVGTVNDVIERETLSYRCNQDDLSIKGKTPIIDQGANGIYGYTEREPDFQASKDNPVILFTNHTCNMWFVNYPFCAIQNVIPFRSNYQYDIFFVFYMTLGRVSFIEYKGHWPDFEQKEYVIPKPEIANKFAEFVKPLQYKIWNNTNQIKTLSALRNTLLPKMMRGEIRVKGFND